VTKIGTGQYRVDLPSLGTAGGIVHVNAFNGVADCKVHSWGPNGTTQEAYVVCFNNAGNPEDSRFNLLFYKENRAGLQENAGYSRSQIANSSAGVVQPAAAYTWNGRGGAARITRTSTGRYTIDFPFVQASVKNGGSGMVTSYGASSIRCKSRGWGGSAIAVGCHTIDGTPVDAEFGVSYYMDVSFGAANVLAGDPGAYALPTDIAATGPYAPDAFYRTNSSNGPVTATGPGTRGYGIFFAGLKAYGRSMAIVTAHGDSDAHCRTNGWGFLIAEPTTTAITVDCYNGAGARVDTIYAITYLTDANTPSIVNASGGTPQSTRVSTPFATPLRVQVYSGNLPLQGVTVNFSVPASGATATLSSASGVTNAAGIAQITASASSTAGTYNVNASVVGGGSAFFTLTNQPGPAAPQIHFILPGTISTVPRSGIVIVGSGFDPATVQVELSGGITIPNAMLLNKSATAVHLVVSLGTGTYAVTVRNGPGGVPSNNATLTVVPPAGPGSHFVPITPCRAVDTRNTGILNGSSTRDFTFGSCGVPGNATAVALNVTLIPNRAFGYLSIWPAGQPQPTVSTMNSLDGRVKANTAIVGMGTGNAVSVFVTDPAHIALDVNGYFVAVGTPGALAFYPLTPCRVLDTRDAGAGGMVARLSTRRVPGGGSCLPAAAQAYSLNVTAVSPAPLGYLTLWPDGSPMPVVSTLNNLTGTVVANAAILRAGTGGAFQAFVTDQTHIIVELNGYFAPPGLPGALAFHPTPPCRIFDTRNANGLFGGPRLNPNSTREFTVPSSPCAVPGTEQAYVTNATVLPAGVFGFLAMWPGGRPQPTVSTLNAVDGALTSNAAIVPAGPGGVIRVYTSDATEMFLDISGYFAP